MKLSELKENIVVVSKTAEEWATVQNILSINKWINRDTENTDTFERYPHTLFETLWIGSYVNLQDSVIKDAYSQCKQIPAAQFISDNTPSLANVTTNPNTPTPESCNC